MRYVRMKEDHEPYTRDQLVWVEDDTAARLVSDQIADDMTPPLMQVTISQPHDLYRPGQVVWLDEAKANVLIERQRATRLVTSMSLTRVTFLTKVDAYNAGETAGFAPERAKRYVEQRQAFYAGPPVIPVRFTTAYDLYTQGEDAWLMETVANHYIQSGLAERMEPAALFATTSPDPDTHLTMADITPSTTQTDSAPPVDVPPQLGQGPGAPAPGALSGAPHPPEPLHTPRPGVPDTHEPDTPIATTQPAAADLPLMTEPGTTSEGAAPGAEHVQHAARADAGEPASSQSQERR